MKPKQYAKNVEPSWQYKYFVLFVDKEKSLCLLCNKSLTNRLHNFKRHYNSFHQNSYDHVDEKDRIVLMNSIKNKYYEKQSLQSNETPIVVEKGSFLVV